MLEKNNFILRLKARQALAGHWQTALVVMLAASLPGWIAQVASLMQGGGLQQQLMAILMYGNGEQLADPNYLLKLVEQQLGASRLITNVLSVAAFLVTPLFTLGMLRFFLELLRGRKDQGWTAVFALAKTGLKGLGLELLMGLKMLLWALPGLGCMALLILVVSITEGASPYGVSWMFTLKLDGVPIAGSVKASPYGVSWMFTLMIVCYVGAIVPPIIAYFRYALSMFYLADHPDWRCRDCLKASIRSMAHQKLNLLLLRLSFLGWTLFISMVSNMALYMLGTVLYQVIYLGLSLALSVYVNCSLCAFYLAWGPGGEVDPLQAAGDSGTVV